MKYCQNCGKQLSDTAKFCPHCGSPIPGASVPPEPTAAPVQSQSAAPASSKPAPAAEPPRQTGTKKRWGIAAQFDAIAAGQKPQGSHFTYFYGFFQLLYHKSFRLFCRTYLPCYLAFCLDIGLLAYASVASADTLLGISAVFLLIIAIWIVVVSIWLSRYYPQELYKQVGGNADRIPRNILVPVLGGVAMLVLMILALVVGLAAGSPADTGLPPSESTVSEPPVETSEPLATAMPTDPPAPTEAPAEETDGGTPPDLTNAVPTDGYWLAPATQPWLGAWIADDGYTLMSFEESSEYTQYQSEATEDGGYRIYCSDPRDGIVNQIYELSPDQATLTELDADGNFVASYRRPEYADAYSPLPQDFWGFYTHVEGDSYLAQHAGPQEEFAVDAFRFGNCRYQELTNNGDGTYTFYLLMPPEGGYVTVSLGTYEDAPAIALYDTAGNVTDVYVRSE